MGSIEVACRRFALLSGITQESDNYSLCVQPGGALGLRKGLLALVTEPAGDHPALSTDACKLVHEILVQQYYADNSLSLTSSLLKALDAANGALLRQNSGEEPDSHDSGSGPSIALRTRRAQVGLTALVLRPDGTGVYFAQLLPTQAYIVHNGHLDALPEPKSWQLGKMPVPLRALPNADEMDGELWEGEDVDLPPVTIPAIPLGSGPSIEVDLLYRRVEPGDLIALVSPSLSRILDQPLAEQIFLSGGVDHAIESLHMLASDRGLAEAHACVLQVGVEATSGVDTDLTALITPPSAESLAISGGSHALPPVPDSEHTPTRFDAIRNPKHWLLRFASQEQPSTPQEWATEAQVEEAVEYAGELEPNATNDVWLREPVPIEKKRPTEVLLDHQVEMPPYQAGQIEHPAKADAIELEFDGWEDVPPALFPDQDQYAPRRAPSAHRDTEPKLHPVPTLFDEEDFADEAVLSSQAPTSRLQGYLDRFVPVGKRAAHSTGNTLRGLLPERSAEGVSTRQNDRRGSRVSTRFVIACAVAGLFCVLALSVYGMTRNPKQSQVKQYLTQAQQEDLLANQPTTALPERLAHLGKAIELAGLALELDPTSTEGQQIVQKAESTQDRLGGVTRIEPKLIYDLKVADGQQASTNAPVENGIAKLGSMEIQGGDLYVLDNEQGRIYRCRVAAKDCATVLKEGDTAGGQKIGQLVGMTQRVGNLIAVDKNLMSYAYSPDTSSWKAQQLGGAEGFDSPKDIASYDGNLYLMDAESSQISKFPAGSYDKPPVSWITDPSSVEQVRDPLSMGIDGSIYVLLSDGSVLVMQGGKVTRTLPAPAGQDTPPSKLVTGTGTQDLYLLTPKTAAISRMSKEGQLRAVLKPAPSAGINTLSAIAVDEGSNKLYMMSNGKIYEASLRPIATGGASQQKTPANTPVAQP